MCTHHGGHLAWDDLLLHLLGEGVLQREVVPPVDQQLVLHTRSQLGQWTGALTLNSHRKSFMTQALEMWLPELHSEQ